MAKYGLEPEVEKALQEATIKLAKSLVRVNIPFIIMVSWRDNGDASPILAAVKPHIDEEGNADFPAPMSVVALAARIPEVAFWLSEVVDKFVEEHGGDLIEALKALGVDMEDRIETLENPGIYRNGKRVVDEPEEKKADEGPHMSEEELNKLLEPFNKFFNKDK